ncbi:MAG: hypothetical protein WDA27_04910 [Actinomycetota bacterium]
MLTRARLVVAISVVLTLAAGVLIGRVAGGGAPSAVGSPPVGVSSESGSLRPTRASSSPRELSPDPSLPRDGAVHVSRALTLHTSARSVQTTIPLTGVTRFDFSGKIHMQVVLAHDIVDGAGRKYSMGELHASGSRIRVTGSDLDPSLGAVVIKPSEVLVTAGSENRIDARGSMRLSGATFTLTEGGSTRTLRGPVTVGGFSSALDLAEPTDSESTLRWTNAPTSLKLVSTRRSRFSWAGSGSIRTAQGRVSGTYGGFEGRDVDIVVRRRSGRVVADGTASYFQVYKDGRPVFRATGRVDLKVKPQPARRGESGSFAWAPTASGDVDMCIMRIRAGSSDGRWVNLALLPLPQMFGGERHADVGGDTRTLRYEEPFFFAPGTQPIDSVIQGGTGDERTITFAVPADARRGTHTIVLVLEGNFPTIRFRARVRIT